MEKERLHKILAARGVASRRACEEIIAAGRVSVDGKIITELGTKVSPDADIRVDGRPLSAPAKAYYILYKPRGYITTVSDDQGRKSVGDLIKRLRTRVYPVGRLDLDSEGLLVLTNDGSLTNVLTHPRFEIEKSYVAKIRGAIDDEALEKLHKGVRLREARVSAWVRVQKKTRDSTVLTVTINRGYNRQIRRMFATVGYPVLRLKRVRIGPLQLKGLSRGSFRALTKHEIEALLTLAEKAHAAASAAGRKKNDQEDR